MRDQVHLPVWERYGMTYDAYRMLEARVFERACEIAKASNLDPSTAVLIAMEAIKPEGGWLE